MNWDQLKQASLDPNAFDQATSQANSFEIPGIVYFIVILIFFGALLGLYFKASKSSKKKDSSKQDQDK